MCPLQALDQVQDKEKFINAHTFLLAFEHFGKNCFKRAPVETEWAVFKYLHGTTELITLQDISKIHSAATSAT